MAQKADKGPEVIWLLLRQPIDLSETPTGGFHRVSAEKTAERKHTEVKPLQANSTLLRWSFTSVIAEPNDNRRLCEHAQVEWGHFVVALVIQRASSLQVMESQR